MSVQPACAHALREKEAARMFLALLPFAMDIRQLVSLCLAAFPGVYVHAS